MNASSVSLSSLLMLLWPMTGFALVGAITPGPVNVLALQHGSQGPKRPAWLFVLGASVSYVLVLLGMGAGAAQLLHVLPRLATWAQGLCAVYLLYLAWKLARAPVATAGAEAARRVMRPWPAFVQGVMVQMLNPKAWLFALSAVGLFVLPQTSQQPVALFMLCMVSLLACLLGVGCWVLLGQALMRSLNTPQRHRALHLGVAALLVFSVVGMLR